MASLLTADQRLVMTLPTNRLLLSLELDNYVCLAWGNNTYGGSSMSFAGFGCWGVGPYQHFQSQQRKLTG